MQLDGALGATMVADYISIRRLAVVQHLQCYPIAYPGDHYNHHAVLVHDHIDHFSPLGTGLIGDRRLISAGQGSLGRSDYRF